MSSIRPEFRGTRRFAIERRLGSGGFGTVFRAFDRDRNEVVALKTVHRVDADSVYLIKQEFRALADLVHPNLVGLYELVTDTETDPVMDALGTPAETEVTLAARAWLLAMELVEGVDFLEYCRVAGAVSQHHETDPSELPTMYSGAVSSSDSRVSPYRSIAIDTRAFRVRRVREPRPEDPPDSPQQSPTPRAALPIVLEKLRPCLRQLTEGLAALHGAGKLHRDIKPPNVLVTGDGQVKILDFGLVAELSGPAARESAIVVGTPAYMAPEQAAGDALTPACDWYSVGVLLYEALTGRVPIDGPPFEILMTKQAYEPRPPSDLVDGVPNDLDSLCWDLLRIDPRRRPQAADVMRRLSLRSGALARVTQASRSSEVPLVGRVRQLAALHRAFRERSEGSSGRDSQAVVVRVYGRSGMGKTSLLKRFTADLTGGGPAMRKPPAAGTTPLILRGRCYQQESLPYKALDNVVDELSQWLKALGVDRVISVLPDGIGNLARLFPVLTQVRAIADRVRREHEIPDSQERRRRAFAALRALLSSLAQERPLVIVIDDVQWGDPDSAELLTDLLRPPTPPPLLLVVAYRSEDAETSAVVRALTALPGVLNREVAVAELEPHEAREVAVATLGKLAARTSSPEFPSGGGAGPNTADVEAIVAESQGNPLFVLELSRSRTAEIPEAPGISGTLDEVIHRRVERLADNARRLLKVIAVAGAPTDRLVAKDAADLHDDENAALALLRSDRLVRITGSRARTRTETQVTSASRGDLLEAYHDRIRESVVAHLSDEARRDLNLRLAEAWERSPAPDPEHLARHFLDAHQPTRAAPYLAQAAERASQALAFEHAAQLYSQALELGSYEPRKRNELSIRLGDALSDAGRGAEAARIYLAAALELATPGLQDETQAGPDALELRRRAAEQLLRSGRLDEGLAAIHTVLAAVGMSLPKSPRAALLKLLWERLRLKLRGLSFRERREAEASKDLLIRIDTCWAVAIGLGFIDTVRGSVFQTRGLRLALAAGEPRRMTKLLAVEAAYSSAGGGRSRPRTERLNRMATEWAERLSHSPLVGLAHVTAGIAAYFEGRWKKCTEEETRAESLLREKTAGSAFELDNAVYCLLFSLAEMGELKNLATRLPTALDDAARRSDLYLATNLNVRVSYLVHLASDAPSTAQDRLRAAADGWSHQSFHNQHWWRLLGTSQIHLYAGEGAKARDLVSREWPALRKSFVLRIQLIRLLAADLRARLALASLDSRNMEPLLREADTHAEAILREKMRWSTPLAKLVKAAIAARRGDQETALRTLISAAQGFAEADMQLHAAVARRRRGDLIGGAEGRALVDAADAWMREQGIRQPERIAAMLAPGW